VGEDLPPGFDNVHVEIRPGVPRQGDLQTPALDAAALIDSPVAVVVDAVATLRDVRRAGDMDRKDLLPGADRDFEGGQIRGHFGALRVRRDLRWTDGRRAAPDKAGREGTPSGHHRATYVPGHGVRLRAVCRSRQRTRALTTGPVALLYGCHAIDGSVGSCSGADR